MSTEQLIAVPDFCAGHGVTDRFIVKLHEFGLLEIEIRKNTRYIPIRELSKVEKILRLYSDLHINLEGIEVITQLLDRMGRLQNEMVHLKNRLQRYE